MPRLHHIRKLLPYQPYHPPSTNIGGLCISEHAIILFCVRIFRFARCFVLRYTQNQPGFAVFTKAQIYKADGNERNNANKNREVVRKDERYN